MRAAFRTWQSLNKKMPAALKELNHHYLALLNKAAIFPIDKKHGLLRLASSILLHPMDGETLRLHKRLAHAFAFLGRGFFHRCPAALQLDILQYADRIQDISLRLDRLSKKLSLAEKIIHILRQDKKAARHYFNWVLCDPEGLWTTLLLKERYRLTSQCLELSRHKIWQDKLTACQNWLVLLQSSLPSEKLADLTQIIQDIKPENTGAAAVPWSVTALRRLDLCTDLAHRLSCEVISQTSAKNKQN
jgi:hypothetical protein